MGGFAGIEQSRPGCGDGAWAMANVLAVALLDPASSRKLENTSTRVMRGRGRARRRKLISGRAAGLQRPSAGPFILSD